MPPASSVLVRGAVKAIENRLLKHVAFDRFFHKLVLLGIVAAWLRSGWPLLITAMLLYFDYGQNASLARFRRMGRRILFSVYAEEPAGVVNWKLTAFLSAGLTVHFGLDADWGET